jgi:hypothetical protein
MRFAAVLLSLLAAAPVRADGPQQEARQNGEEQQQPEEQRPKREVRTLQLGGGSFIRYEVMPGDDQLPPGQLIVMHVEPAPEEAEATQPAPPALADEQAQAEARAQEAEQERARAAARNAQNSRAVCEDLRGKLAARLLELRGVQVDPDVALWVQRNLYFATNGTPSVQIAPDPLFFSAVQSDATALGIVKEIARCEGTAPSKAAASPAGKHG